MDFLRVAVELASPVHAASVGVDAGECNGIGGETSVERLELFRGFGSKVNEGGNRNPRGSGSTTIGTIDSTVITGKSGLACVLAAENAERVRTAPSEADSDPPTRAEVWRVPTQNNTSQQAILLEPF
jgi:hypothetical protein